MGYMIERTRVCDSDDRIYDPFMVTTLWEDAQRVKVSVSFVSAHQPTTNTQFHGVCCASLQASFR